MLDVFDTDPSLEIQPPENNDSWVKQAIEEYEAVEKWFNGLDEPTMAETVRYASAKRRLEIIMKRSEKRKQLNDQEQQEQQEQDSLRQAEKSDNELFVSQDPVQEPAQLSVEDRVLMLQAQPVQQTVQQDIQPEEPAPVQVPLQAVVKKKRPNRISVAEYRKSMEVGFEPIRERLEGKNKRNNGAEKPRNANSSKGAGAGNKAEEKKRKEGGDGSMLLTLSTNVIKEAHGSSALPAPASFTANRRQDVMTQLIVSIRSQDREKVKDATLIKNALKSFTNKVMSSGDGGWRMKGLKTKMYNYQLFGCAFMRERENSPDEPRGGILGDMMGFGKTFAALVNIVDGLPSKADDPAQTTLLVVPSHLPNIGISQIRIPCMVLSHRHLGWTKSGNTELKAIGRVVEHHAMAKLSTLDDVEDLQNYSIVITTYQQFRQSYPSFKPPKELTNGDKLEEQWAQIFEENRGPLRIKFHRIVLDEAHTIKNWKSSVSIAVRGLMGQNKWLLSGTPVTKFVSLDLRTDEDSLAKFSYSWAAEIYPLLSFLGVPGIGKHDEFLSYYRSDELGDERLSNLLKAYMCRRTHSSRLFALPIIQLPDIKETRVDVEFSEAEWMIYQAIEEMFSESINDCLGDEANFKTAQCRCVLVMILRLRMFCSHPLTVQHLLKDLLGPEGSLMKELATSHEARALKYNYKELVKHRYGEQLDQTGDNGILADDPILIQRFHQLMLRLNKENEFIELYDRTVCPNCQLFSDKTVVTSCPHLYCEECFTELYMAAEGAETADSRSKGLAKPKPSCMKCASPIEEVARGGLPQEPIRTCGARMPGAKLTGIKNTIEKWNKSNKATKVVIFSQYKDFIRILAEMCEQEGWGYRCLSGKMRIPARHKSLEDFKNNAKNIILIVTHKCILVDLWWNAAAQKREEINNTMGDDVLKKRDTVVSLLKLFADVEEDGTGRLYVKPKLGRDRRGKIKNAITLGKDRGEE
ncbi:SNF2 family N-terminal domain-containing protein [Aspergillus aurantiobrunneus]